MKFAFIVLITLLAYFSGFAQIPTGILIKIAKAEDALAYDATLETLMRSPVPAVRTRAALAAGRIGNDAAVTVLIDLLEKDTSVDVKTMAAFALGEIESVKAADAILKALKRPEGEKAETRATGSVPRLTARLVEAAGKIAAANPKDERCKALGEAILDALDTENRLGAKQDRDTVILGLTAALRTVAINPRRPRPDDTDFITAEFLKNPDPRIRADAANTLARLRAKNANADLRAILTTDKDGNARASATRALGAAEDKASLDLLLTAATEDADSRVRVSAIRALGSLRDAKAAGKLIEHAETLTRANWISTSQKPSAKNEILEIVSVLGRLLAGSRNEQAVQLFSQLRTLDDRMSPEITVAWTRVAPGKTGGTVTRPTNWRQHSSIAQLVQEYAAVETTSDEIKLIRTALIEQTRELVKVYANSDPTNVKDTILAASDDLRAFAAYKTDDLTEILIVSLASKDLFFRATAADLLAIRPMSKVSVEALKKAFSYALLQDKDYNDAQLSILAALYKLDKKESVGTLLVALNAPDYLVRKKAFELLADKDLQKDFPGIPASLENARKNKKDQVQPYSPVFGTKLGQVLNTDADYRRALSRKNGTVKAVLTTEKGTFTIDLYPEEAPLTVDNFVKLARSGYFNGLEVHRVVPNFVMQDGDPRGDGNGGPGWSIRCEVNMREYDRGAVGMALSGKDTGGSQWFVTHSPQPHLDGGYTVFGHVNETGMKVVDAIVRGDKILSVKIIGR